MIRSFYLTESGVVRTDLPPSEWPEALDSAGVLWVDFFRATKEEAALLADVFRFHPLAIDDCLRPVFRPKVDAFQDYIFLIVHGSDPTAPRERGLRTLELDAFLGRNFLVTFRQAPMRSVQQALEQCERAPAETLGRGADFLLYTILDRMVENYSPILARLEAQVAQLEERVLRKDPGEDILPEIMRLRRDFLNLRRVMSAQRDAVTLLSHQGSAYVSERARVYFRDVADLYRRALEILEIESDALRGARETHLGIINNRQNEIMQTLTIFATIGAMVTVIASIYGMNFRHMPELEWKYGYPFSLGLMAAISAVMLYYFRRKKWF